MAVLEGVVICVEENTECVNNEGSFACVCVGGYELTDGKCQRKEISRKVTRNGNHVVHILWARISLHIEGI